MTTEKVQTRLLSIGAVARRTGLSVSAIRFYEDRGLVTAHRSPGGNRLFARADIRRLSFIMIAQRLGFSLETIALRLATLPPGNAPDRNDWKRMAAEFRTDIDARIAQLVTVRDRLDGCIGCGCLSLDVCALYNARDEAGKIGSGPQKLLEAPD